MSAARPTRGDAARQHAPATPRQAIAWFRRRLRGRPDTEHEMMLNRLCIVSAAMVYLSTASAYGASDASMALRGGLVLCGLYTIASLILFADILLRPVVSHGRRITAMLLDMTVLSIGMHIGDSAFALGYPIYLWIIFGNGFRFGVPYLAASAIVAAIGFAIVIATTPIWLQDIDLSIGLMAGLFFLPAYVAALIRKLSEAKRQAEEANKAKSMFLASVSHELRTPLNAIITLSDLLAPSQASREPREMVQTIAASGRSLLALINNILDLSRIEAGRSVRKLNDFDLGGLLAQLRRVLLVQARAKRLDLNIWIDSGVPLALHGAEQELEEILMNLAGNAIKFTSQGGVWIAISAEATAAQGVVLSIEVRDSGIGIAPEAQARIFDSFVQADASIIDRFGGTGLGLSIVKQLVELNGGAIRVASVPGQGSAFTLTFAAQRADGAGSLAAMTEQALVVSRNLTIEARLLEQGLTCRRLATLDELTSALEARRGDEARPVIIIDVDTLAGRELAALAATSRAVPADGCVGVMSLGAPPRDQLSGLPFAVGLAFPPEAEALAGLMRLARPFAAQTPRADALPVSVRPLRILVAEDNVTNQKVIAKLLQRDGHAVDIVANGELAVEALLKAEHDLVLMDINMPVMNGLDATKLHRFGALGRPRIPIYALTADVTPETRAACAEAGLDGCLHKPIDQDELQAVLAAVAGAAPGDESASGGQAAAGLALAASRPEAAAEEAALIDAATLGNLLELGGSDFVADLVAQFTSDALLQIDQLAEAVQQQDSARFRDVAHSLRSSSANVGANRMFSLCLAWRNASTAETAELGEGRVALLLEVLEQTQVEMGAWLHREAEMAPAALKRAS